MHLRWLGAFIACLPAATLAQTAANTVTISGNVIDDSGTPVAGTRVFYNNSPASIRDRSGHTHMSEPLISSTVTTAKDGTFSVTGLPPGVYWLCAEALQPTQIRSCDWGYAGTKIDLTKNSSAGNVTLQLHSGVTLTFQVTDARNQIKDFPIGPLAPGTKGNFRIFVVDRSLVKWAQPVSVAGNLHQYNVTVPSTRSLRLLLDTKLTVVNQSNTTMAGGAPNNTIPVSGQPITYKLTVP